ncbi:hypothetical protein I4U23_009908 [Adineta vaga]|nr:hypothetical protein I4U23_009908 [Adineta vaga]
MNINFTFVDITHTQLTTEGCKFLAQLLQSNSTLTDLFMGANSIGDDGAIHIAQALIENTTLKVLSLDVTKITDNESVYLAELLQQNMFEQNNILRQLNISQKAFTRDGCNEIELSN